MNKSCFNCEYFSKKCKHTSGNLERTMQKYHSKKSLVQFSKTHFCEHHEYRTIPLIGLEIYIDSKTIGEIVNISDGIILVKIKNGNNKNKLLIKSLSTINIKNN